MIGATDIVITVEIEQDYYPLPVGWVRPGMRLIVADENGKEVPEGEKGEIIIAGRGLTVGAGYFKLSGASPGTFLSGQDGCGRDAVCDGARLGGFEQPDEGLRGAGYCGG